MFLQFIVSKCIKEAILSQTYKLQYRIFIHRSARFINIKKRYADKD